MEIENVSIGVIGAGNMGRSLAGGIAKSGVISKKNIFISDNDKEKIDAIVKTYGVNSSNNHEIASKCKICIIAVKPDVAASVLQDIAPFLATETIVLSIVAGLCISDAERIIGNKHKFIRAMPNTPMQVGEGMTAISSGARADKYDMELVEKILSCTGNVVEIDENKMDAVTGLSGSGPAYIFQIIEAMSDGGVLAGLPRDKALTMAAQTVLGAAKMVLETGLHPAVLKDMVTSPAGTTIEGILAMERGGVRKAMIEAVIVAAEKSKIMSGKK